MCRHTPAVHLDLPPALRAGRIARRALRAGACHQHAAHLLTPAELLISELVSNAVRHGAAPITLDIDCVYGQGMVLAVTDSGPALPQARHVPLDAGGGRGIHLVDMIATRWGVTQHRSDAATVDVKEVWVVLDPEHFADDGTPIGGGEHMRPPGPETADR